MSWLSGIIDTLDGKAASDAQAQVAAASAQNTATLEAQQATHDAAVKQDTGTVSDAFSQFNPDYYNNYAQSYQDAYNPALDDQYGINKNQLQAQLADSGQLDGSTGAYQIGQLDKQYATAKSGIANSAQDAANTMKQNVNSTENNLYGLANQAVDPLQLATQAQGASSALVSPQSYPSVASTVAAAFQPIGAAAKANSNSQNPATLGGMFNMNPAPISPSGGNSNTGSGVIS